MTAIKGRSQQHAHGNRDLAARPHEDVPSCVRFRPNPRFDRLALRSLSEEQQELTWVHYKREKRPLARGKVNETTINRHPTRGAALG